MHFLKKQFVIVLFVAVWVLFAPVVLFAANLGFSPTQTEVQPDSTFQVDVTVDPGTQQIQGTDMFITYDPDFLELSSVSAGSYFPSVSNTPSTGSLYIAGFITDPGDYKTGTGTVATVTFKALKEGTTTLTYACDLSQGDSTSKVVQNDPNTPNIIDCAANEDHTVVISADAPASPDGSTTGGTTQLPQSGVYEDMVRFATMGGILLVMGISLRVLLRIV